jgi:glycerol-3-phosphate dehydrogenase (NAD+)
VKLPTNIVADPDPIRAAEDATLLVFVLPHQFVNSLCLKLKGKLHHRAKAISLIKVLSRGGVHSHMWVTHSLSLLWVRVAAQGMAFDDKGPVLISSIIEDILGIDVSVLCGANIAKDVAWEHFSETTIGTHTRPIPLNLSLC